MSLAPEIDQLIPETGKTSFTEKITNVFIGEAGKVWLPRYGGTSKPKAYITFFRIAMGRAQLREEEKKTGYCQLFGENLYGAALEWFSKLEQVSIDNFKQGNLLETISMFMDDESTMADLWKTQQSKTKSLKDYMNSGMILGLVKKWS